MNNLAGSISWVLVVLASWATALVAVIFCVYLIATFGPLGWIFAAFFFTLVYGGILVSRHLFEVRRHRRQIDNIYVSSLYENDRTVLKRAQHHEKFLKLAGNYVDEKGKRHGNGVKVVKIIFRDSMAGKYREAPAETWEEFEERRDLIIRQDRIKRHLEIDQEGRRDFYEKVVLNQK